MKYAYHIKNETRSSNHAHSIRNLVPVTLMMPKARKNLDI